MHPCPEETLLQIEMYPQLAKEYTNSFLEYNALQLCSLRVNYGGRFLFRFPAFF